MKFLSHYITATGTCTPKPQIQTERLRCKTSELNLQLLTLKRHLEYTSNAGTIPNQSKSEWALMLIKWAAVLFLCVPVSVYTGARIQTCTVCWLVQPEPRTCCCDLENVLYSTVWWSTHMTTLNLHYSFLKCCVWMQKLAQ